MGRKPRQAERARRPIAPNPADGEPSSRATGTIRTAVTVAPVVMVTVYRAVINDVRSAKYTRMNDGMATLQTASPDMPSTVPASSIPVEGMPRTRSPAASRTSESRMAFSSPRRRVSQDVAAPAIAKLRVGMEGTTAATSGP